MDIPVPSGDIHMAYEILNSPFSIGATIFNPGPLSAAMLVY